MLVGARRGDAAARRAGQQAAADQVRLEHVFERVLGLVDHRGEGLEADGVAALDQRAQQLAVDLFEAEVVDAEPLQALGRGGGVDRRLLLHLCEVAHAAEDAQAHARRAAAAFGAQLRRHRFERHAEPHGGAQQDLLDVLVRIRLEPFEDAEARAERRRQQALARRRADERERLHAKAHAATARPRVEDDVDRVVLHGGVEVLLQRLRQPVDLVDEQHLVALEPRQRAGEVLRRAESGA